MQLGIGTYTHGWASGAFRSDAAQRPGFAFLTARDLIDKAVRLDVPLVQICVKPDLARMDDEELRSIRRYADQQGKTLEVGTMGSDPDHLLRFLDVAQILGSRLVRTVLMDASPGLKEERGRIAQVVEQFAAARVVLAIENYEMTSFLELRAFCEEVDSEYVGVCLDTVNSLGRGEGVREVTEALMPFTQCLHVKDFAVVRHESSMAMAVIGAPAGEGRLDIPAQIAMLRAVQPDASIVLEQWTPIQGDFAETVRLEDEWAVQGIRYLKRQLAGM